jgi:hypothetical protein
MDCHDRSDDGVLGVIVVRKIKAIKNKVSVRDQTYDFASEDGRKSGAIITSEDTI